MSAGRISRRTFLASAALAGCAGGMRSPTSRSEANGLIGYTEYRTNLPTRYDNQVTSRAFVVDWNGWGRREIAPELVNEPYAWTQFAGWSPDGRHAVVGRGWESPENGAWEEANKTFRMTEGWLFDMYLVDIQSGAATNLTAVERVSEYNSGLIFMPGGALGFTALIDGVSHPFVMDMDGRNKRDLNQGEDGFSYGFSASPDGARVAYHKDYQVYVANADGSEARRIETGHPFNFVPQWSPGGEWLLFVSGEHYDCHPHLVRPDGSGLRKLADRGGYEGVVPVYDVYDFHGGSSDVPVWSVDGRAVYFTARIDSAVELMLAEIDGPVRRLTRTGGDALHYHPKPSPDGHSLAFGSNRTGVRQLYRMPAEGGEASALTSVPDGRGAMWAHWRP